METINKPEIPEEHLQFIKKVAKLAVENDIQKVDFSYLPNWRAEPKYHHDITGKISVNIKTTDQRGRPKINININMDSHIRIVI